jgi:hypothetical protein
MAVQELVSGRFGETTPIAKSPRSRRDSVKTPASSEPGNNRQVIAMNDPHPTPHPTPDIDRAVAGIELQSVSPSEPVPPPIALDPHRRRREIVRTAGEPGTTPTTVEAIEHADWFVRYALDRLPDDADPHPGIQGHLTAARVQLEAALKLSGTGQQQQLAA